MQFDRLTAKDLAPFFPNCTYDQLRRRNTTMKQELLIGKGGRLSLIQVAQQLGITYQEAKRIWEGER